MKTKQTTAVEKARHRLEANLRRFCHVCWANGAPVLGVTVVGNDKGTVDKMTVRHHGS